jgi:hypothetical protein
VFLTKAGLFGKHLVWCSLFILLRWLVTVFLWVVLPVGPTTILVTLFDLCVATFLWGFVWYLYLDHVFNEVTWTAVEDDPVWLWLWINTALVCLFWWLVLTTRELYQEAYPKLFTDEKRKNKAKNEPVIHTETVGQVTYTEYVLPTDTDDWS